MNSRERLLLAANHLTGDRVPIDLGATRSGGISSVAYNVLKKYLGFEGKETKMYDIQQQICWLDDEIIERFNIDIIDAGSAFLKKQDDWNSMTLNDGSQALVPAYLDYRTQENNDIILYTKKGIPVGTKQESSYYFNQDHWPWKDLEQIPDPIPKADFENQLWAVPSPPFFLDIMYNKNDLEVFKKTIETLYKNTTKAVLLDFGIAGFFETPTYLRGMENWFMDLIADPAGRDRFLDSYLEYCLERLETILGAVGEHIDVLRLFWDDLGSQENMLFSPELFKSAYVPKYRKLVDFIHSHSKAKILFHSCGSIYKAIPGIIDAGIDMINPVQIGTANMQPEKLKKEFGKDILFWGGGIDTVNELTTGTPTQVKDAVKRNIEIFAKDGGFVFTPTHNIQPGVPPENIVAMFEAANDFKL